ncbi:MAG TPA: hypothetical protein VLJ86_06200 [Ramlibacter sp.]|nr:hypothetical protein [Ramlibacter sp.]
MTRRGSGASSPAPGIGSVEREDPVAGDPRKLHSRRVSALTPPSFSQAHSAAVRASLRVDQRLGFGLLTDLDSDATTKPLAPADLGNAVVRRDGCRLQLIDALLGVVDGKRAYGASRDDKGVAVGLQGPASKAAFNDQLAFAMTAAAGMPMLPMAADRDAFNAFMSLSREHLATDLAPDNAPDDAESGEALDDQDASPTPLDTKGAQPRDKLTARYDAQEALWGTLGRLDDIVEHLDKLDQSGRVFNDPKRWASSEVAALLGIATPQGLETSVGGWSGPGKSTSAGEARRLEQARSAAALTGYLARDSMRLAVATLDQACGADALAAHHKAGHSAEAGEAYENMWDKAARQGSLSGDES